MEVNSILKLAIYKRKSKKIFFVGNQAK